MDDTNIVENWLRSMNLARYSKAFIDNGYDDLEVCKLIDLPDLNAIGVEKHDRGEILDAVRTLREDGGTAVYFTLELLQRGTDDTPNDVVDSDVEGRNRKQTRCLPDDWNAVTTSLAEFPEDATSVCRCKRYSCIDDSPIAQDRETDEFPSLWRNVGRCRNLSEQTHSTTESVRIHQISSTLTRDARSHLFPIGNIAWRLPKPCISL